MGRGKIEIKRIENTNNRQVTYSKRRNGLIKKAKEISVLCDAKVSLVIFASSGKMHEYCSPSTNLVDILDMYQQKSGKRLWDAKHENLSNEIDRIKKENDNMQIELRHLKGEDITSLNYRDLMSIEEALENGLVNIRDTKSEYFKMMKRNAKILQDQNDQLHLYLQQQEMAMEGNARGVESNYCQQRERNYSNNMPFKFRLAPLQPNLQERM